MPQVFRLGPYIVYFWSNEGEPLEPLHVHVAVGKPRKDATKIWITTAGNALVLEWKSDIAEKDRKNILRMIEANHKYIIEKWIEQFGVINHYC